MSKPNDPKSSIQNTIEDKHGVFDAAIIETLGAVGKKWVQTRKAQFARRSGDDLKQVLEEAEQNRKDLAKHFQRGSSIDDETVQCCMKDFFQRAATLYGVQPDDYYKIIEIYQHETFINGLKKYSADENFADFFSSGDGGLL